MQQKQTADWIEYITDTVNKYYAGRKIVLWGKYQASDDIKDRLIGKYGIDTAFYVDSNTAKIDGKQVLSTNCLDGKSDQYYVVIPIATYQSVREKIRRGGGIPRMWIIIIFAIAY